MGELTRPLRPGGRLVLCVPERAAGAPQGVKAALRAASLVNVQVERVAAGGVANDGSWLVAAGSRRVVGTRESVQARYGALADAAQPCCGPAVGEPGDAAGQACCCAGEPAAGQIVWQTGYGAEQVVDLPQEAVRLSLGCGNPTALASLGPGEVVLDIGSGAGVDAFYAAQKVGPSGRVIGLDMTPEMVQRARGLAAEAGLCQVEFRLGQAEEMPVDDGEVDIVLSNCVINLCEDKGKVFE
ncbi:MAG: methyltransferase domain-containing protein, partial [Chloroflexi bacterium]|nr:methyltransferase domain-containing protein [Chloroflexota bacterium]